LWKGCEAAHLAVKGAIGEKAQRAGHLDGVVESAFPHVGLPNQRDVRHRPAFEAPFHRGERRLLMVGDQLGLLIPGGKCHQHGGDERHQAAVTQVQARLLLVLSAQRIERAQCRDHEGAGDQSRHLIVGELHERPSVQEIRRRIGDVQRAVRGHAVADGMLHESVGHDDEVAGEPASGGHSERGDEMVAGPQPPLSPYQRAHHRALQEKSEHPLHGQCLADHPAREVREFSPVGAELKLHRQPGDDAHREVEPENLGPEARGLGVALLAGS
jgi:hypothetical protein